MPLAFHKERKQNEKNHLLDFSVQGKQITLQERPSPSCSRSSSRIDNPFRPMSATPSLFQQEKHRKTPPWNRPQSADHATRSPHGRKMAVKFERDGERKTRKEQSSMISLLESSSLDENLDFEISVTPSPVPSLNEVLRSTAKLQPGIAGKPPIPPVGTSGLVAKKSHKSMDDIINIKFQRWFPESVHNINSESDKTEQESRINGIDQSPNFSFGAYDGSEAESLPKNQMDPIAEDDILSENHQKNDKEILTSKVGQSLNKYLDDPSKIRRNSNSSSGSGSILRTVETTIVNDEPKTELVTPSQDFNNVEKVQKIPSNGEIKYELPKNGENGLNSDDIFSWMGENEKPVVSTYDEIINMIKVLEKEEVESVKIEALSAGRSGNNSACSNVTHVGAKDIITFLDELDRSDSRTDFNSGESVPVVTNGEIVKSPVGGRMAQLMSLDSAELAKRVMALTLELEERESVLQSTNERLKEVQEKQSKTKSESDSAVKRHQKFIDQLITEKRLLGDQCASLVKEMETKQTKAVELLQERHAIELKKLQEKMLAAEKLRRDKWLEEKTKKIKEQTVKGLEPELERMTRAHQEELAEIRRAHDRELTEMEASCSRRIATSREQALRDREQAVMEEREAARKKLEHEMAELERSYQEQRRRLMGEVRDEKERLDRDTEANLVTKSRQLEEKWQQAQNELDIRLSSLQEKHEIELRNMRDLLEGERQSWLNHQANALSEKEKAIKEQCRKERDRHIDTVIRKIDAEAQEKEKLMDSKIIKIKEQYESDLREAEAASVELKRKLKEARNESQQHEETIGKLKSQISQLEFQNSTMRQRLERSEREACEKGVLARSEASSQILILQKELNDEKLKREGLVTTLQAEKERELQQVYNRVKEAISKKEETVRLVQKQRDAALEQCSQLENILEHQRKEFVNRSKR